MAYIGKSPTAAALTASDVTDGIITSAKITDATIVAADMANDAISLAKMASGTDGNIISYDASGDPVAISTGSDGQVLTSTGAGSPPAFEAVATTNAAFVCKVWINLDGTGTIAIRDDEGVSSVTDNGTGDYTITFDTAFANDDYCAVTGQSRYNNATFNNNTGIQITSQTTTIIRVITWRPSDEAVIDHEIANVAIFGEQS